MRSVDLHVGDSDTMGPTRKCNSSFLRGRGLIEAFKTTNKAVNNGSSCCSSSPGDEMPEEG